MFKGSHFCPKVCGACLEVKECEDHKQLKQLLVQTVLPLQLRHKDAFNKGLFGKKGRRMDRRWEFWPAAKPSGTHSQKQKPNMLGHLFETRISFSKHCTWGGHATSNRIHVFQKRASKSMENISPTLFTQIFIYIYIIYIYLYIFLPKGGMQKPSAELKCCF